MTIKLPDVVVSVDSVLHNADQLPLVVRRPCEQAIAQMQAALKTLHDDGWPLWIISRNGIIWWSNQTTQQHPQTPSQKPQHNDSERPKINTLTANWLWKKAHETPLCQGIATTSVEIPDQPLTLLIRLESLDDLIAVSLWAGTSNDQQPHTIQIDPIWQELLKSTQNYRYYQSAENLVVT